MATYSDDVYTGGVDKNKLSKIKDATVDVYTGDVDKTKLRPWLSPSKIRDATVDMFADDVYTGDVDKNKLMSRPCVTKLRFDSREVSLLPHLRSEMKEDAKVVHTNMSDVFADVMKWLDEVKGDQVLVDMWAAYQSCPRPDVSIYTLKRLQLLDPPAPWFNYTCEIAIRVGANIKMLTWLRNQSPPCPWGKKCIIAAATKNDDYTILIWLRSQDPPCPWVGDRCELRHLDPKTQKFLKTIEPQ